MARKRTSVQALLTMATFLVLEVASLSLLQRSSTLQNIWINRFTHRVLAFTWGSSEHIRNYFNLRRQNETLAMENASLIAELQRHRALEDRLNARFLLDSIPADRQFRFTPASVIKISRNSAHNYIILDKGTEDGIRERDGIITPRGVVGIVYAVDRHYAYGLTLMNNKVSVSARIGTSGIVAPLQWDGRSSHLACLQDVPIHYSINPGDTIRTSGFSSIYPADLPLGVVEASRPINGISNQVDVRLFEDFSTLRYVVVASNPARDILQKIEMP